MKINGEMHYLWRAVDHEGEVLEVFATKHRDRKAALAFLKRTMKRNLSTTLRHRRFLFTDSFLLLWKWRVG